MWNYIFINIVYIAEALGNHSQLGEPEFFIQIQRRLIACHYGVELQDFISGIAGLLHTIFDQHFADVLPPALRQHGVRGVADMTAAAHVIGVEYV